MAKKKDELEEKLLMKKKSSWEKLKKKKEKRIFEFSELYKQFMDKSKTEREAFEEILELAKNNGFISIEKVGKLSPRKKIYLTNKNKNVALIVVGKEDIEKGLNIIASHIDAPRLDLKQNPLYEDTDTNLALFKTHYYGGIKKYQWVSIPLALHGIIIKSDGSKVEIKIGENLDEPVFSITDLLPHLSKNAQNKRKLPEGIKGEELNILVGSRPIDKDVKEKVKLQILNLLNKKYGIVEEDFVSAELEAVPAINSRDIGFDKSLIGAYGQDDRICAFTSLKAILNARNPNKTCLALFVDKEEIGSEGNTSMKSSFIENIVSKLLAILKPNYTYEQFCNVLSNSKAISADVGVGVNPNYKDVHELKNAAKIGYGIVLEKYTGHGGKYMASDASAEYVYMIRKLFNENNISWQTGVIGKVDEGGGGTVAKFLAQHNMDVIDCGPPLLAMHSPFEIASKADIFSAYEAYHAFFEN